MNTCQHCRYFNDTTSEDKEQHGSCHLNPPLVFVLKSEIRRAVRPETKPDSVACACYQQRPLPVWSGHFSFSSNPEAALVETEGGEL